MKLLIKKKSYILMGIILPAFVIIFFTFEFGNEFNEIQQKIVNERTKSAEWYQRFINEFFNIYLTSKFY